MLPELDDAIKGEYPFVDVIRPDQFRQFVSLNGSVVVNTSCCGGSPALVSAFMNCGAAGYAGVDGYPDGDDAVMYALGFIYHYLVKQRSPLEAHRKAAQLSSESFVFHSK